MLCVFVVLCCVWYISSASSVITELSFQTLHTIFMYVFRVCNETYVCIYRPVAQST